SNGSRGMATEGNGKLIPVGGGDEIPLLRNRMVIGRRESCDIPLRFPNVSGRHCELTFQDGYWTIIDLGSTNGVKVNGDRIQQKRNLKPDDEITIASRRFTIDYIGAGQNSINELMEDDIMSQ